jgi:hypothetical protein
MSACLLAEIVCGAVDQPQKPLPLATEDIQRYVWESAYGPMLIEVRDGAAYVNGQRVEPLAETRSHVDEHGATCL